MKILRISGWLVATALAGLVGVWTYAIGIEVRAPRPSPIFGYSLSGKAAGNFAYSSFATREENTAGTRVTATERRLAHGAYRREPLSTSSLALLAKSMSDGQQKAEGAALFELAGKLTRRNFLISNELIKLSATQGNQEIFFAWLSRVMLTNDVARKGYSLAMADATARDDSIEALLPVLGAEPRWSDDYWKSVVTRPASLANAARIRMGLARRPWRQVELAKTDRELIGALVNDRQFGMAEKLAMALGLGKNGAGLVRNGDFATAPSFSPFDWELATLGNLGASINENDKNLSISAIGGAKGLAAQQLLRLRPGSYRLSWSLSGNLPESSALSMRISCAEADADVMTPVLIPLAVGKKAREVTISGANCSWYRLSILTDIPDDAMGMDAYLDDVALVPVGAAG